MKKAGFVERSVLFSVFSGRSSLSGCGPDQYRIQFAGF
jgi:hypothetical protein